MTTIVGGILFESYSHISQFISESYATGTPYGEKLRYFGFLPSGICFFLFGMLAPKHLPKSSNIKILFLVFAIFYGLGTIAVSIFPCDEGCNPELIDPSISQLIHNVVGGITYLMVPMSILLIGLKAKSWLKAKSYANTTLILGAIALLFTVVLFLNPKSAFIGLFQRIIETAILSWILLTSHKLKEAIYF